MYDFVRVVRGAALLATAASAAIAHGASPSVSEARRDPSGLRVHTVRSEYQTGETLIKVLVPDRLDDGKRYPALYVLPVEAGEGTFWGQALDEVKAYDLHNKHGLICVYPTFSHLPWYADHPSNPEIRQESYFLRVVVPAIESRYPAIAEPRGRLLVGFSKSGWGAFCLLLRHPELFGRAAAWDAPLWVDRPAPFGMGGIFATQENFEKYRISKLLVQRAELLARPTPPCPGPRLVLLGYDSFRPHHQAAHDAMQNLKIPHIYRDGPQRKHHWQSGWLAEAVECLMEPR